MSGESALHAGQRVINAAVRKLEQLRNPPLMVDGVVDTGDPRLSLLRHAHQSSVVVMGRHEASLAQSVAVGSTVMGVTRRSPCPVICVPADWIPRPDAPVVVGVDASPASLAALTLAFEEASVRGAPLTLAYAWALPDMYADITAARVSEGRWRHEVLAVLEDLGADPSRTYPHVQVGYEVRHQPPIAALLDLSTAAQLLVLGPHGHFPSSDLALGSVTHALVHRSHCPVEIAPQRRTTPLATTRVADTTFAG